MESDTKQFLEALNKANGSILYWYGPIPKQIRELLGWSQDKWHFIWMGTRIHIKPRFAIIDEGGSTNDNI